MKKILASLSVILLMLTACSGSGRFPSSFEEMTAKDLVTIYEDAIENDAIDDISISLNLDDGELRIGYYGNRILFDFQENTEDKEYVEYVSYAIESDDDIKSVMYTDKYPNFSSDDYSYDEMSEARDKVVFMEDESDIPNKYIMTYDEAMELMDDTFYNIASDPGDLKDTESSVYDDKQVTTDFAFKNSYASISVDEDITDVTFTDNDYEDRISFTFDNRVVSEDVYDFVMSKYSEYLD